MTKEQWKNKVSNLRKTGYVRMRHDDWHINPTDIIAVESKKIGTEKETHYFSFQVLLSNGQKMTERYNLPMRFKEVKTLFRFKKQVLLNQEEYKELYLEEIDEEITAIYKAFCHRHETFVRRWTNTIAI